MDTVALLKENFEGEEYARLFADLEKVHAAVDGMSAGKRRP